MVSAAIYGEFDVCVGRINFAVWGPLVNIFNCIFCGLLGRFAFSSIVLSSEGFTFEIWNRHQELGLMEDGPPDGPQTQKDESSVFHILTLVYIQSVFPSGIVVPLTTVPENSQQQLFFEISVPRILKFLLSSALCG